MNLLPPLGWRNSTSRCGGPALRAGHERVNEVHVPRAWRLVSVDLAPGQNSWLSVGPSRSGTSGPQT